MHKLVRKLFQRVVASEQDEQLYHKYIELMRHDGWKVHQGYLLFLRGLIAEEMLSDDFTKLETIEKDVSQRAYNMTDQVIQFLLDPMREARKQNVIKKHNQQMGATRTGK